MNSQFNPYMLGFEPYFYHLPVGLKAGAVVAAGGMSRLDAYRVFLAGFTLVVGPFVFFNVTKTKYLQILTTIMRYLNNQSQLLGQHIQTCFLTMNFLGLEIKMFRAIFVKFLVFAIIECKLLQLLFNSYRWAAFFCMVTIACVRLSAGKV